MTPSKQKSLGVKLGIRKSLNAASPSLWLNGSRAPKAQTQEASWTLNGIFLNRPHTWSECYKWVLWLSPRQYHGLVPCQNRLGAGGSCTFLGFGLQVNFVTKLYITRQYKTQISMGNAKKEKRVTRPKWPHKNT
jgi:hypothetical protein